MPIPKKGNPSSRPLSSQKKTDWLANIQEALDGSSFETHQPAAETIPETRMPRIEIRTAELPFGLGAGVVVGPAVGFIVVGDIVGLSVVVVEHGIGGGIVVELRCLKNCKRHEFPYHLVAADFLRGT